MGNWKLEVFRMGCYVLFPVGAFFFFNHPKNFERYVEEKRRALFPPDDPEMEKEIKDFQKMMKIRTAEKKRREEEEQMRIIQMYKEKQQSE